MACVLILHSFPSSHLEHDPVLEGPAAVLLKQRRKLKVLKWIELKKRTMLKLKKKMMLEVKKRAKDANDDRAEDTIDG